MLHSSSSPSSRRRRASKSGASSPAQAERLPAPRSAGTSPGRRASIAVSPVDVRNRTNDLTLPELICSPRHSIIPDIALMESTDDTTRNNEANVVNMKSPRHSLVPDCALSPRNSLVTGFQRPLQRSLSPSDHRSPRDSLVCDPVLSPRNSLTPEPYNRSPRNSLVPDQNRSPRHSLTPESNANGSRLNISDINRSPRNSLLPDDGRLPGQFVTIIADKQWIVDGDKDTNVKRDLVAEQRTSRGSVGPENACEYSRSPRGSIINRNSLAGDTRSSRGSLTLTFHEPSISERRKSADNPSNVRGRSSSPSYRSLSKGNGNMASGINSGFESGGSRRASSSVSQVSGDEQRRLCSEQKINRDTGQSLAHSFTLTTYGSVAYQLKDANMEATSTFDFVCKALKIFYKTVLVTVLLVCLSIVPLVMIIMGIQFLRDCPMEPNIPIYMVVGGTIGSVKMGLTLWNQLHTKHVDMSTPNHVSVASKVASVALTIMVVAWFGLGNYWILRIKYPDYTPSLFDPNRWCDRTLYIFSLMHLYIVYSVIGLIILLMIVLALCQLFGCEYLGLTSYK